MRTQELNIMRLNIMNLFKKTRVKDGREKRIECFARNESKTLINRVKTWPDARLTAVDVNVLCIRGSLSKFPRRRVALLV